MSIKRSDQLNMLKTCAEFTETGEWNLTTIFTYPGCGVDLVKMGLATEDGKITDAGKAALWLAAAGSDPLPDSKAVHVFKLPNRKSAE